MRCPKCGFHGFDHLDTCSRCNADLRPFKTQRATAFNPPPTSSASTIAPPTPLPTAATLPVDPNVKLVQERLKLEGTFKGGANWFYWIAVLSMINTVILLFGGQWGFIVGLGITTMIGAVAQMGAKELGSLVSVIAFVSNLLISGVFALFGYWARQGKNWSFIVGMFLYTLDGFLLLLVQDYLGIAFHALALLGIFVGLRANKKLMAMEQKISY